MDDTRLVNEGCVAEQFIGQHLFFRQGIFEMPRLNYWLRENANSNAEVDYVIEEGHDVLPVEVKAGRAGAMKALQQMMMEKHLAKAMRFDASKYIEQDVSIADASKGQQNWKLTSAPLYAVGPLCCRQM